MEDEKKKKRNKKKKNKQTKTTTDDVAVGEDPNHVTNGQKDDVRSQASEPADIQNVQVDADRHQSNGAESVSFAFNWFGIYINLYFQYVIKLLLFIYLFLTASLHFWIAAFCITITLH